MLLNKCVYLYNMHKCIHIECTHFFPPRQIKDKQLDCKVRVFFSFSHLAEFIQHQGAVWKGSNVINLFMQRLQRTLVSLLISNSQHHDVDSRHHGAIHRLYILKSVELSYLYQLCYFHHVPIICKQACTQHLHGKKSRERVPFLLKHYKKY